MRPHEERVVEERRELDERIEKLGAFIDSDQFNDVDPDECTRLVQQHRVMVQYSSILELRIKNFPPE